MALTVIRYCPKCKAVFECGPDRRGLGEPFLQCSNCQQIVLLSHITEWDLKNWERKLWYLVIMAWTSVFYGGMGFILAYLGYSTNFNDGITEDSQAMIWGGIGIVVIGAWLGLPTKRFMKFKGPGSV